MQYEMRGKTKTEKGTLWTTRAVAREFGVADQTWKKWIQTKQVPPPNIGHGCRIYYAEKDLPALLRACKMSLDRYAARKAGWSSEALANEIGVPKVVMQYHLKMGNIASPSKGNRYDSEEADIIKNYFARRKNIKATHWNLQDGLLAVGCDMSEVWWANASKRKAGLLEGIPCVKLGAGRKDTWFPKSSLVQIRERIRIRKGKK